MGILLVGLGAWGATPVAAADDVWLVGIKGTTYGVATITPGIEGFTPDMKFAGVGLWGIMPTGEEGTLATPMSMPVVLSTDVISTCPTDGNTGVGPGFRPGVTVFECGGATWAPMPAEMPGAVRVVLSFGFSNLSNGLGFVLFASCDDAVDDCRGYVSRDAAGIVVECFGSGCDVYAWVFDFFFRAFGDGVSYFFWFFFVFKYSSACGVACA